MISNISEKRALVTGGSGELGAAICKRLAVDGYSVIVHAGENTDSANRVAKEINSSGGIAQVVSFDVTDTEACEQALHELGGEHPIQILVSNAGVHSDAPMAGMSQQQWQQVIDVNLQGFFNVSRPLIMPMARTRWGRIIGVSSIAARGNRGQANYAAAKAGMEAALRCVALEMGSRGITANCVAPGIIESAMTKDIFDKDFIRNSVPVGRTGKAEEVAALVAFLASEDAAYITGQTIAIDGGMR